MQDKLQSKLPDVGTTIFATMSKLAQDSGAINLSQGFPDFSCSEELIDLVNEYMEKGFNQYAPMAGVPALREAISVKINDLYHVKFNPETEITITAGATQAIYTAITALVNQGDEVILFDPSYDCYAPSIRLNGGTPVHLQLKPPHFNIDWDEVKNKITSKTRMIIINTPHNPTGAVLTGDDLKTLEDIAKDADLFVLSDEVYEHITFDGRQHESILKYPELSKRSLAIFSFGKVFHNTGWKLGYCVAPEHLSKEFRKVHQFIVFACNNPIQHALAEFLQRSEEYLSLNAFFQKKRDYFIDLLKGTGFKVTPCEGTYFQLLDYSDLSDEKDLDFAVRLTKEIGVASIPVSVFYKDEPDNRYLRFCFAKSNDLLEKAAKRLSKLKTGALS